MVNSSFFLTHLVNLKNDIKKILHNKNYFILIFFEIQTKSRFFVRYFIEYSICSLIQKLSFNNNCIKISTY